MAGNAKQYNDLDSATQVNETDLVAVGQSGASELKKATVRQLADPIAATLSTGALAELEYATSQGKNAIATALTNKGVQSTAADTLIQMADKVNNLEVDTTMETIVCAAMEQGSVSSQLTDAGYGAAVTPWTAGLAAIVLQSTNTLYIIKRTALAQYTELSFNDLVASAVASIELDQAVSNPIRMAMSPQGTAIAVWDGNDSGKMQLYRFDPQINELIHHQTLNLSALTGFTYSSSVVLKDDATLVFYVENSSSYSTGVVKLCVYSTKTETLYTATAPAAWGTMRYYNMAGGRITEDTILAGAGTFTSGSTQTVHVLKIPFTEDFGGDVTLDVAGASIWKNTFSEVGDTGGLVYLGPEVGDLFVLFCYLSGTNTYTDKDGMEYYAIGPHYPSVTLINPADMTDANTQLKYRPAIYPYVGGTNSMSPTLATLLTACMTAVSGNEIKISLDGINFELNYNKSTKVLSLSGLGNLSPNTANAFTRASNMTETPQQSDVAIINRAEDSQYIYINYLCTPKARAITGIYSFKLRKNVCPTKKRTVNGQTTYFQIRSLNVNDVAAGRYDYGTTITPAVSDEA